MTRSAASRIVKGKRIGTSAASNLTQLMAAYVGLHPKKDVTIERPLSALPGRFWLRGV